MKKAPMPRAPVPFPAFPAAPRGAPDAIKTAVELSARYINDRKLPDKAIDVIDEVGAGKPGSLEQFFSMDMKYFMEFKIR